MFSVKIDKSIKDYCTAFIDNSGGVAHRGKCDGTRDEQILGMTAESVVKILFGQDPVKHTDGFDGGVDIEWYGCSIDVKSMGRKVDAQPWHENNIVASQQKYNTDLYIFTSTNKLKDVLTVCGWIEKDEYFKKAKFLLEGSPVPRSDGSFFYTKGDMYELKSRELHDVQSVQDMINQITAWCMQKQGISATDVNPQENGQQTQTANAEAETNLFA